MGMLAKIFDMIGTIPGAFWGVIAGSFFSLGGVMLSNRASDRRLRAQFEYERNLRNNDRELALRKEVYLDAAEAILMRLSQFSKIADLEIATKDISNPHSVNSAKIAKIHVIGCEETIEAVMNVSGELETAYMEFLIKRQTLMIKKNMLTILDNQINSFSQERDKMLEYMKQYNLQGSVDQRRWDLLQGNFDFEQNRISETSEKRTTLAKELALEQLDLLERCTDKLFNIGMMLIPVVLSMRKELLLPINEKYYNNIVNDASIKQSKKVSEFIDQIRKHVVSQLFSTGGESNS